MPYNRKNIIRENDRVLVVKPEIFERCGYPYTLEYARENLIPVDIKNTMDKFFKLYDFKDLAKKKILNEIGYHFLKENNFGGSERKIYSIKDDRILNKIYKVVSKRHVKTGIYKSGIDFEFEYNPPYLSDEKTKPILFVALENFEHIFSYMPHYDPPYCFEIEADNVKKINK